MVNYYGFPPGYSPDPAPTQAQPIPSKRLDAARRVNAQRIRPDGEQVARRHYGKWIVADWLNSGKFGAWREVDDYPDGWVKL